jgi:putative salt-induced outer membrane protein YdiY
VRRLLLLVIVVAAPTAASAQIVNVLTRFPGERRPGLHGSVQLSVDWRTGNTPYLDLQGALAGEWLLGRHLILGLAQGEREITAGKVTLDHTMEHLRYRYHLTGLLRPEAFVQHELDLFRRLELRLLLGAGMRFDVLRGKSVALALGLALMGEHETLRQDGLPDAGQVTDDLRVSTYLALRLSVMKHLEATETVFVQPRIDDPTDLYALSETSLTAQANKVVSLALTFSLAYDSRPPLAVLPVDTALKTTVQVAF